MNKRPIIFGIITLLVSALAVVALLLTQPNATPNPGASSSASGGTITLPNGAVVPADPNQAVNEPEPDGERNPDGTLKVDDPHFGDDHVHAEDVVECGDGPYTLACDGEEPYDMPSAEAISKASAAAKAFAYAWLTISPTEASEARQARLSAAGATGAVPSQISALTRPDTKLSGLVTTAAPYGSMYSAFTRVTDGDIVLVVSVNAAVKYELNGSQEQTWTMPGTMLISINPTTEKITNVVEVFPDLKGMS